tara:strand:- start:35670 stop:35933 length:264 start_codon:yes stop_codon:yes gene_type:complete
MRSRTSARFAHWSAICIASVLVLTACGGGGGDDAPPAQPAPANALVWGSGTWGTNQWSATAAPARIEPESSSTSLTASDLNSLETSR